MSTAVVYKDAQGASNSSSSPLILQQGPADTVTTVERRILLKKSENVSATHRTIVEIRTSLDNCEETRAVEETRTEQEQAPVLQYRVVPRIKEVEVPEVHVEYDDTYVEVPVPFELPIIAPRQVPVEQVVQRNIPKPINVHTVQRYRMPRIQPKYYDVKVPIYVPSYVEVPIPSHFVALKGGEKFPEHLVLGPTVPHLPSCPVVPDLHGRQRYAAEIKVKDAAVAIAAVEQPHQHEDQAEVDKMLVEATTGPPTLHRRGSQGSDLGYSSSALVRGAYPSVEFVAVSTNTSVNDDSAPTAKDEELQLDADEEVQHEEVVNEGVDAEEVEERPATERGDFNEEEAEVASDFFDAERMNELHHREENVTSTKALGVSPALIHAAA